MDQQDRIKEILRLKGEGLPHTAIAARLNIGTATITRDLTAYREAANSAPEPVKPAEEARHRLGGSPLDRELVRLKDENARLRRELETGHREALDEDEVRRMLGTLSYTPPEIPNWLLRVPARRSAGNTSEVPVLMLADWHRGEVVSAEETNGVNAYDPLIMEERVRRVIDRAVNLATEHGPGAYPGIVCTLLGDFVSGGLHPELAKTDEEEPIVSALKCRDLLIWALTRLADVFGKVYVPAVAGNHGRMTHKPEFKRYVYKNADWLIYQMLIRHFSAVGDERVVIDVRPSNEVYFRVWEKKFLAMHGDMLGVKGGDGIIGSIGPIMRGEIKTRGSSASSGFDYDHLLIGHWHQPLWLPRVFVSNTIKGFDEYAKNGLRAPPSVPSQSMFFVHPKFGITSRWEIYAETPVARKPAPWASVFDPGASS